MPSPTPEPAVRIAINSANVREGPGTTYGVIGAVGEGQVLPVVARTVDNSWYVVLMPNGERAWLSASVCEAVDAVAMASVQPVETIPAPPPTVAPPPTPVPAPTTLPQPPAGILVINELSDLVITVQLWDCCENYFYEVKPGTSYLIQMPPVDYGVRILVGACERQVANIDLNVESPVIRVVPSEDRCGAMLYLSNFEEY